MLRFLFGLNFHQLAHFVCIYVSSKGSQETTFEQAIISPESHTSLNLVNVM